MFLDTSGSSLDCEECTLLGGTKQIMVQLLCGFLGFASLILKKKITERNIVEKRTWKIWGMDVSKQATSGITAHIGGMVNAKLLLKSGTHGDECSWYFISFTFDTTLGVLFGYIMLYYMLQPLAKRMNCSSIEVTGNYVSDITGQISYSIWFIQLVSWCIITGMTRALIGCILYLNEFWLGDISMKLSEAFMCYPDLFLLIVMIGCPFGMNALQLWIQDQFLKKSTNNKTFLTKCVCKRYEKKPVELSQGLLNNNPQINTVL